MSYQFSSRTLDYVRSFQLRKKTKQVLLLMKKGDILKEYHTARVFLHSSELPQRASKELTKQQVSSLIIRGLVYPIRETDGSIYQLTEDGDLVANLLSDKIL